MEAYSASLLALFSMLKHFRGKNTLENYCSLLNTAEKVMCVGDVWLMSDFFVALF